MKASELRAIVKICRDNGVSEFYCEGIHLHFFPNHVQPLKSVPRKPQEQPAVQPMTPLPDPIEEKKRELKLLLDCEDVTEQEIDKLL